MHFCPNCGFKFAVEEAKFCSECGTALNNLSGYAVGQTGTYITGKQQNDLAYELLKNELYRRRADQGKDIANSLVEKWKVSGKFPQKLGRAVEVVLRNVLPPIIQSKLSTIDWQNEAITETS